MKQSERALKRCHQDKILSNNQNNRKKTSFKLYQLNRMNDVMIKLLKSTNQI